MAHNRQLARGGADVVYEREVEHLVARGHQVERFEVTNHDLEAVGRAGAGMRAVWNAAAVRDLTVLFRRFAPDVLHVHTPFPLMSPAVFRVARRLGVATVTTVHGYRYSCPAGTLLRDGRPCRSCVGRRIKLPAVIHGCYHDSRVASAAVGGGLSFHHLIGTLPGAIDRYLALTAFGRDQLIADGVPASKVVVRPNFVLDPGPPRIRRDGHLLFAGRLTEEKGVATLVEAWRGYSGSMRLVVVGDGPLRPLVDALARRDPRVTVTGWLTPGEVLGWVALAEALVFPSEWPEALPLVVLEAFAAGTPVVASDLDNVGELVEPGSSGWRFRAGDPGDLTRVLGLVEGAHRGPLRAGSRACFEARYHPDPVMDQLESIYAEVVARTRVGPVVRP